MDGGVRVRGSLRDREFARFRQTSQRNSSVPQLPRRGRHGEAGAGHLRSCSEGRPEGHRRSQVELDVKLLTGPDPETLPVAYASPRRRSVVVGVSLTVFAVILAWAGGALWRAAHSSRLAQL
jgi:hypothetical protein